MPQSLAKVYLHLVFSTKHRQPSLADAWRDEAFAIFGGAIRDADCYSIIVGGMADHVHMLFQQSRTITIADVVKQVKLKSSKWINDTRQLPQAFYWQAGYAIFSVSHSKLVSVRDYIFKQPEHHRKRTYQDELGELLILHKMEWDERYVWD